MKAPLAILAWRNVVRAFRLTLKGRLAEMTPKLSLALEDARGEGDSKSAHWFDLTDPSHDDLAEWLDASGAPALLKDLALSPKTADSLGHPSSGAFVSDEGTYFFFPFYGSEDHRSSDRFAGICLGHTLITFHAGPLPALEAAQRFAQEGDTLPQASAAGLLAALLRLVAERSIQTAASLRQDTGALSRLMTQRELVPLGKILELQTHADTLGTAVDEQLTTVRALSVGNHETLNLGGLERHVGVTVTNLETLARALDRIDRHVDSLRAQYDSLLAERTNRRLAILTVFSAIFMPLTLIAGIYGMNFKSMPELEAPSGYPITLSVMGILAAAMLMYFWKRGWFD